MECVSENNLNPSCWSCSVSHEILSVSLESEGKERLVLAKCNHNCITITAWFPFLAPMAAHRLHTVWHGSTCDMNRVLRGDLCQQPFRWDFFWFSFLYSSSVFSFISVLWLKEKDSVKALEFWGYGDVFCCCCSFFFFSFLNHCSEEKAKIKIVPPFKTFWPIGWVIHVHKENTHTL